MDSVSCNFCLSFSRDRNREHAKNTRLRKKAYVTKLKGLVDTALVTREAEEKERRKIGEKILKEVREMDVEDEYGRVHSGFSTIYDTWCMVYGVWSMLNGVAY
ncbi:bZIP transcription factor [archaeon]|nr:MAG: bZIP transcription factor [archaeon]